MNEQFTITFPEVSIAEANKLAMDLSAYLDQTTDMKGSVDSERDDTQDAGAILTVVLGSASSLALFKGLSNWLMKTQSRKLTIKKNGDIIGENLSSRDIEKLLDHTK